MKQGDTAYPFILPSARGETVDVGELIGSDPVLLLFIPFAFSSTCTTELCRVGAEWPNWDFDGAHVFGISADSPWVVNEWRRAEGIPFPVLADFGRDVIGAYGVLDEDILGPPGVARRSAFVIDRDGVIAYRWIAEHVGMEPDYDEIKSVLEGI